MEYTIRSNHGELTIGEDGYVVMRQIHNSDSDEGRHLTSITRFNLAEWKRYWSNTRQQTQIDILDIGYWYDDAEGEYYSYEPPVMSWRKEIAEALFERKPTAI